MSSVRVAIPLYRGKRRFHLEKGRQWSILEHLVLEALAKKPHSVASVAAAGSVHQRLVIEMLIRLMRAGWVELHATASEMSFAASPAGIAAAAKAELPNVLQPVTRWMNFVVDRVTGTIFKPREMPFLHKNAVEERATRETVLYLPPRDFQGVFEVQDLIDHLFHEDERFIAMESGGDRLMERYGLVAVRGQGVEGLPDRAPKELVDAILELAASDKPTAAPVKAPAGAKQSFIRTAPPVRAANLSSEDIIVGGSPNLDALKDMLKHAREKVIIHSTFMSEAAFTRLKPDLLDAAKKGARIDLLWGEGDDPRSAGRTMAAVQEIRRALANTGEDELIRLHPYSTRSHAKFAIADRPSGNPAALIGSCNWLSSDMTLVEASVRLRDTALVSDLLFQASELSRGRDGHWNDLTSELASYASRFRNPVDDAGSAATTAQIILGPTHKPLVVRAVESAKSHIFVTSHRIATAARQAVLLPLSAEREANAKLIYGIEPKGREPRWADIAGGIDLQRVRVMRSTDPQVHAKILGWDDDDVVITSQNWLSADPTEANPRREIGVHLHGPGLAARVAEELGALNFEEIQKSL